MSFDVKTDPADIPENGERLNQTIKEAGTGKSYRESAAEKREACIVKTVVDNGERTGKELSFPIYPKNRVKYNELIAALGAAVEALRGATPEEMARGLKELVGRRFQASVSRVPFETESGKYVRYRQTFFTEAEGKPQIRVKHDASQFRR